MKGVEINGNKLHEVGLHQKPHAPGTKVTMRYPKHRIQYSFEEGKSFIKVPSLLAVELYRSGTIPQNSCGLLKIKESGREVGVFLVKEVIYPEVCSYEEGVSFELERTNG
jgi:hypothetical protein